MTGASDRSAAAPRVLLQLQKLRKSFGRDVVLHDISFDVLQNEFLTILGPSGSGKTTILRLIGGFEVASGGAILLDGSDIAAMPINRRPFNTVFQDYALFPHMTVRQNIGYGLRVRGTPCSEIVSRVGAVIETVGLTALGERLPAELSGGQRQRVALARAIVLQPRLVLLDEPLAALDVELRAQMRRFLKDLQRRLGITFVFITHDQEEAITLSDRIVVMRQGRIEQIGQPEDLYYRPATPFVAGFFGENNLIAGTVLEPAGRTGVTVETSLGPLICRPPHRTLVPDMAVVVAVRPESLVLAPPEGPENRVTGHVTDVQFAGSLVIVDAVVGAQTLRLRTPSRQDGQRPAVGDLVTIGWHAADATVAPKDAAPKDTAP